jgi:hypothetical protein
MTPPMKSASDDPSNCISPHQFVVDRNDSVSLRGGIDVPLRWRAQAVLPTRLPWRLIGQYRPSMLDQKDWVFHCA